MSGTRLEGTAAWLPRRALVIGLMWWAEKSGFVQLETTAGAA